MVGLVKLAKNGNGTTVTIPKPFMRFLAWSPADDIAIVANEDHTVTLFRVTRERLLALRDVAEVPGTEATVTP